MWLTNNSYGFFLGNLVENDHLEDRRGNGGIILRLEFGKWVV
jgi:hypothetical protein